MVSVRLAGLPPRKLVNTPNGFIRRMATDERYDEQETQKPVQKGRGSKVYSNFNVLRRIPVSFSTFS